MPRSKKPRGACGFALGARRCLTKLQFCACGYPICAVNGQKLGLIKTEQRDGQFLINNKPRLKS